MKRSLLPLTRRINHGSSRLLVHAPARFGLIPAPPLQQVRHISIPQIMFNASHPHIIIPSASGPLYRNIRPSFPKNADKVVAELNALFADQPEACSTSAIGSWQLEATCDALSAFFILASRAQVAEMLGRVLDAAERLNHHPSISASEAAGGRWVLLATCGTHRPAGLSVKDPRLARCIGEISGEYSEPQQAMEEMRGLEGLEEWHWRENMGRARVSMDGGVEEEGREGERSDEQHHWRLNTVEDVEAFAKGENEKEGVQSNVPTLKGLVL